jgi:hypothetical protein
MLSEARRFLLLAGMIPAALCLSCTPEKEGLSFPYQNAQDVVRSYCFGLQPWDTQGLNEIHGGIDLVPPYDPPPAGIERYPIAAPADSVVAWIVEGTSGHELTTIPVILQLNDYWYVISNFEPQTASTTVLDEQRASITVEEGQALERGDLLGDLLVGDVQEGAYPHVHFAFFYLNPNDTLEYVAENHLNIPRSDGTNLPPSTGSGSPWNPRDLGIPTTLFCPYVYSTSEAQAIYDALPKKAANGDDCACVCAYGSENGDCGVCPSP